MNPSKGESECGSETAAPMNRHKCVADVMTHKTVTLSPHHSLTEVVSLMADRHFRHVVVVDTAGRIVGVISDRDILRALSRTNTWQTKDVSQIMTREPFTVKRETPVSVAVAKIVSKRINCLPVLDDEEKVCGIVTSTDLLKAYQKLLESLEHHSASS
jgi:acetoin utilization protein AcuB